MLTSIRLVQSYGRGQRGPAALLRADRPEHARRRRGGDRAGPVQLRHRAARGAGHLGDRVDRRAAGRPARRSPSARWCSSSSSRRTCSSPPARSSASGTRSARSSPASTASSTCSSSCRRSRTPPTPSPAPRLRRAVSAFQGVTFAYHAEPGDDAPPVLRDVTFEVRPGEVVALVGRSGAGKSTIAQLIPRLYDPDTGVVLVDGADLRRYTLESLRSQVSLVLQDTVLLSGTMAENIGYGIDGADPGADRAGGPAGRTRTTSSRPCRTATTPRSASAGRRSRAGSASASPSRAPSSGGRRSSCSTSRRPASTPTRRGSSSGRSASLMRGTTTIIISHDPSLVRCADRVLRGRGRRHRRGRARPPSPACGGRSLRGADAALVRRMTAAPTGRSATVGRPSDRRTTSSIA